MFSTGTFNILFVGGLVILLDPRGMMAARFFMDTAWFFLNIFNIGKADITLLRWYWRRRKLISIKSLVTDLIVFHLTLGTHLIHLSTANCKMQRWKNETWRINWEINIIFFFFTYHFQRKRLCHNSFGIFSICSIFFPIFHQLLC